MKRWLWLSLLLIFCPFIAQGETSSGYVFAYISSAGQIPGTFQSRHVLNMIDPTQPDAPVRQMPLPDSIFSCGTPSPDGRWLPMCYRDPTLGTISSELGVMLLEMATGAVHSIATISFNHDDWSPVSEPQWSPDGRYLLWNTPRYPAQTIWGVSTIEFYDLQTQMVTVVPMGTETAIPEGFAVEVATARGWSPDGSQLAVLRRTCFYTDRPSCKYTKLETYSFPAMTRQASISLHDYATDLCGHWPIWSPSNRYLTFVLPCESRSLNLPFTEVFVWDTQTGEVRQITAYTNPPPDTWTEYPPERRASYRLWWHDEDNLLISVKAALLHLGKGIDPDTIIAHTESYSPSDDTTLVLTDSIITNWTRNPVTGQIAARMLSHPTTPDQFYRDDADAVQFLSFDGNQLIETANAPGGCEDLTWSPDGQYLAYTLADPPTPFFYCDEPVAVVFVNATGEFVSVPLHDERADIIGWVTNPDHEVDSWKFPEGTPTPIPTRGPAG